MPATEIIEQTKRCTKCGEVKSLSDFYRHLKSPLGRRSECKDCSNSKNRDYATEHRNQIQTYQKLYRQEHAQAIKENGQRLYQKNKAHRQLVGRAWYQANKAHHHQNSREWRERFPEQSRAIKNNHRRKRCGAAGVCTGSQWIARCEYYGWQCYLCATPLTHKTLQMEHRIPICRGGSHWPSNLAPACAPCNQAKDKMTEREYRARLATAA